MDTLIILIKSRMHNAEAGMPRFEKIYKKKAAKQQESRRRWTKKLR
jgi:hypothetical protein